MHQMHSITELSELESLSGLIFLLFSTPSCGVCQSLKQKLPCWSHALLPSSRCYYIDLTIFPQACSQYQVLSAPTLLVFLDHQVLSRQVRHINLSLLKEQLSRPVKLWQESY